MTELLEQAVATVRGLSPEVQNDLARVLLQLAGEDQPVLELTPEEEADLIQAQAEMAWDEFATDAEVQTVLSQYRLSGCLI